MDSNIIMEARGVNGQIELFKDRIRIKRKGIIGFLSQGLKGDKDILISSISSIQFKTANILTNGYIQFAFMGGKEAKGGLFQASQDENSVMFRTTQQSAFENIKSAIETRMSARNTSQSNPSINLIAILTNSNINSKT